MQRCAFARIRFLVSGITYVGTSEFLSVMWRNSKDTPSVSKPSEPKRPKHHHENYGGSLYCIFSVGLSLALDLFVSLFQGLMLPPNHILSILLSHQFTIKKVYRLHSCNIKALYYTKLIPAELCGSCAVLSILAHQSTQFHKSPRHTLFQSALSGLLWSLGVTVQQFCRKSQAQVLSFGTFQCCNMSM